MTRSQTSATPQQKTATVDASDRAHALLPALSQAQKLPNVVSVTPAVWPFVLACFPGFNGPVCSVTDDELKLAQQLRGQLLISMRSLVATENPSAQAVESWSNSLGALTANPIEVPYTMISSSVDIVDATLQAGSSMLTSTSIETLFSCINSLSQVIPAGGGNPHRRLEASSSSSLLPQVDALSQVLVSGMVEGQSPRTVLLSNMRTTSQICTAANPALVIPQTLLETAAGAQVSRVQAEVAADLPLLSVSSISAAAFHLSLPPVTSFNSTNQTTQALNSNPLRLQYRRAVCSPGSPIKVVFTMVHASGAQDFIEHNENETHSLRCTKGVPSSATFQCASEANVTIICDGSSDFLLTQACPVQQSRPTCYASAATVSTELQPPVCHVANYSKFQTTCVCNVCSPSTAPQGHKRRLQTGDISSTVFNIGNSIGVAAVISLTETSVLQFAAIAATAGDFNSVNALKDSLTVILSFITLWLGMFLLVVICHRKWYGDRKRLKETHQELVERSLAECKSLEDSLHLYMVTFFPHVYTDQSGNARFAHALLVNATAKHYAFARQVAMTMPFCHVESPRISQSVCR